MKFTSEITVEPIDQMGSDLTIARAAWVSTMGERAEDEADEKKVKGLINYLMKHRHGTPFEHNAFTFRVKAPIFVFREWHRHRVAWSYNEVSGRYSKLEPLFYVPPAHRPLVNVGTSARPEFAPGTERQKNLVEDGLKYVAYQSYACYQNMLNVGVANEVARMCLPLNIYSSMYATSNARAIMHFLGLRTNHPEATFPSLPQWEIAVAAKAIELFFTERFPITYQAFVANGRVAP